MNERYVVLDGLRGICAISVMIFHYFNHTNLEIFKNAPIAVDLFFMLSGFVLLHSFTLGRDNISLLNFMIKRAIRLYPFLILGLILGAFSLILIEQSGRTDHNLHTILSSFILNALLIPYLNGNYIMMFGGEHHSIGNIFPMNGAMWSLFYELLVNCFFLLLAKLNNKNLIIISGISLFLLMVFVTANSFANFNMNFSTDVGWGSFNFIGGVFRVFFCFTLGMIIYRLVAAIKQSPEKLTKLSQMKLFPLFTNAIFLIAILTFVLFPSADIFGLRHTISVIFIAPIILFLGAFSGVNNKILNNFMIFIGWLSYPLYCLHTPIGNILGEIFANNSNMNDVVVSRSVFIFATLVISIIATKFYEEPTRREILIQAL